MSHVKKIGTTILIVVITWLFAGVLTALLFNIAGNLQDCSGMGGLLCGVFTMLGFFGLLFLFSIVGAFLTYRETKDKLYAAVTFLIVNFPLLFLLFFILSPRKY